MEPVQHFLSARTIVFGKSTWLLTENTVYKQSEKKLQTCEWNLAERNLI